MVRIQNNPPARVRPRVRPSGVGSGVAPGVRAPLVGLSLRVFISRRLLSQEESSVRGAADVASRSRRSQERVWLRRAIYYIGVGACAWSYDSIVGTITKHSSALYIYPFESQKVAFLQPPAAHARALSNGYARNTLAAIFACLNFEP